MKRYRIVLADDHIVIRRALKKMIEEVEGLTVVGEAGDGLQLLQLMNRLTADLVIVDVAMPGLRGIEATRELKKMHPDLKILVLSMYKDEQLVYNAISAGADGYILKDDSETELFLGIRKLSQGGIYISPHLAKNLASDFVMMVRGQKHFLDDPLTIREREVVGLIAEGKTSRQIAELLFISKRTVMNHRTNIMKKLGFKKTAELVKYAIKKNYTSPSY